MTSNDRMLTFTVDMDATDAIRTRTSRGFLTRTHQVVVQAETDHEAIQVATQMVAGHLPSGAMVTATRIVSVVA